MALLVSDFNFKLLTATCLGSKFIESKFAIYKANYNLQI